MKSEVMSHIDKMRDKAASLNKTILFPEAEKDIRVLRAAAEISIRNIATPVLVGDAEQINKLSDKNELDLPEDILIEPVDNSKTDQQKFDFFAERLAHKSPTEEQIQSLCSDPLFTGGWLLQKGAADAAVAGSVASTANVIRSAIRTVGVAESSSIVSSSFMMEMPDGRVFTYADCAVVPYPDAEQLASIALDAGKTHLNLTEEIPRIAFLSFSTKGSAVHERVELVQHAYKIAAPRKPEWIMEGEVQFDTAIIPEIAAKKAPDSALKGDANVFVFPNLDAANIGYKLTERLAGAKATGPILQGLAKPYMDLSRGCSVDDIVNTACVGILLSE
jgi:phosphate acetyltransferase